MADRFRIEPATPEHIASLAPRLREHDREEALAFHSSVEEALANSYGVSERAWAALRGDEVVAAFGVIRWSLLSGRVILWVATTDAVDKHKIEFARTSRAVLEVLFTHPDLNIDHVIGLIDTRYDASLRWARWLGFRTTSAHSHMGINGESFVQVELDKRDLEEVA